MSVNWYPVIDYDKCIGCMACSDMCRHGVYKPDAGSKKPKVVYGNGCIYGCHGCAKKCPVGAISYFGDDGTVDIAYNFAEYKPCIRCAGKPKVAFVCVHNSCRSQMAEALGKLLAADVFASYSAGTELKDQLNPDAVRLMRRKYGIDMESSQQISERYSAAGRSYLYGLQCKLPLCGGPVCGKLGPGRSDRTGGCSLYESNGADRAKYPGFEAKAELIKSCRRYKRQQLLFRQGMGLIMPMKHYTIYLTGICRDEAREVQYKKSIKCCGGRSADEQMLS